MASIGGLCWQRSVVRCSGKRCEEGCEKCGLANSEVFLAFIVRAHC
jgi:hypothetical protein